MRIEIINATTKILVVSLIASFWKGGEVLFSQDLYQYELDLVNVKNDKVSVELLVPEITKNKIKFYFAKIVPGTYQEYDFGRFISEFSAYDKDGSRLPVEKTDHNTYQIQKAKSLYRITYQVDDTYDATEGQNISGMSGTNISEGEVFVLNSHGFYGYFDNMSSLNYEIRINKPKDLTGSSSEKPVTSTPDFDVYKIAGFGKLADTPMLYCKPDHTTLEVGGAQILVSVYSPMGVVESGFLMDHLQKLLEAQKAYFGGKLPVDRYAFLMYFLQPGEQVGTGALEHNYSSLYALPDLPQEQIIQPIINISSHEFLHILTPLNIHSEEIHYFDFNDPEMSQHLWLYEGVTEYFAHHAQLVGGLTTMETYLTEMSNKITSSISDFNDNLPFTELSENCLNETRDQYANVYQKGAIIGWCLDIILRKYSDGEMGLIDLMNELAAKYGQDQPFKDRRLFRDIAKLTFPEVKEFFNNYVDGTSALPLASLLEEIGISYSEPESYMGYSLGNVSLGYNPQTQRIYVADVTNLNSFGKKLGYQTGDEFLKINGEEIPTDDLHQYFQSVTSKMTEGENLNVEVYRSGEVHQLEAIIEKVSLMKPAILQNASDATDDQIQLRNLWLQCAGELPVNMN